MMKYHTMLSAFEIGWEESGVARMRGLLALGNRRWQGEPVSELDLGGRRIRPESVAAFARFSAEMRQHGEDAEALRAALHAHFGQTYWYYFVFHLGSPPGPGKEAL